MHSSTLQYTHTPSALKKNYTHEAPACQLTFGIIGTESCLSSCFHPCFSPARAVNAAPRRPSAYLLINTLLLPHTAIARSVATPTAEDWTEKLKADVVALSTPSHSFFFHGQNWVTHTHVHTHSLPHILFSLHACVPARHLFAFVKARISFPGNEGERYAAGREFIIAHIPGTNERTNREGGEETARSSLFPSSEGRSTKRNKRSTSRSTHAFNEA